MVSGMCTGTKTPVTVSEQYTALLTVYLDCCMSIVAVQPSGSSAVTLRYKGLRAAIQARGRLHGDFL